MSAVPVPTSRRAAEPVIYLETGQQFLAIATLKRHYGQGGYARKRGNAFGRKTVRHAQSFQRGALDGCD